MKINKPRKQNKNFHHSPGHVRLKDGRDVLRWKLARLEDRQQAGVRGVKVFLKLLEFVCLFRFIFHDVHSHNLIKRYILIVKYILNFLIRLNFLICLNFLIRLNFLIHNNLLIQYYKMHNNVIIQ